MRWGTDYGEEGRTCFQLWAPALDAVALEIDGRDSLAMEREGGGWFSLETEASPGARYRYRIPGDLAVPDPASRAQADDVHGWSVIVDPDGYEWRAQGWRGRPWEEAVIYECHAGLLGGFSGVAEKLPELVELGVSAVELMPIAAFSGTRNWGYDGVLPYAPAAAYGSPDDLKALVDRAHELGLMIYLDVVYNHFGPDGNYLGSYAPDFFHPEVETPWGGAVAFDREPVRRFFIDNALMWLGEYRFDGLRFDAVHAIANDEFLDAMAAEIRTAFPQDRQIHLILENEGNDAERLEQGYDGQWNDDFHNVVHVLLTGETFGYYRGFSDSPTEKLARCLRYGFIYQGDQPGSERGTPSGHLPPSAFVSFLQNHDQIGNRATGERLTVLTDPNRLKAVTAMLLLSPHIPLMFMGDEVGSRSPFLFFTDFHDELADAVREGRRKEFAKFPAFSDPKARERIPDPNDPETFERSKARPPLDAGEWRTLYKELLALRRSLIVPGLRGAESLASEALGEGAVLASWRLAGGAKLMMLVNLGIQAVALLQFPAEEPFFALGERGAGGSFAAWLVE